MSGVGFQVTSDGARNPCLRPSDRAGGTLQSEMMQVYPTFGDTRSSCVDSIRPELAAPDSAAARQASLSKGEGLAAFADDGRDPS